MAQAEEKSASIDSKVLFQTKAPEVARPQVLFQEPEIKEAESQSIKNKLSKVFKNIKFNARITEEVKCINDMKANLDAKMLGYRNNLINF
ncbi:MAG: hypothetical protein HWN79_02055 [Candidatus Lokiarchaeota archaeon]|nr:hypothetical protein [Candidatus Lokiarchaeota archaeon]